MPVAVMLMAAGRGERMRPLTDTTPKPLLAVHGKPLMQWPLEALARGGFYNVVVNTAWLGEQIADFFGGNFSHFPSSDIPDKLSNKEHSYLASPTGVQLRYSREGRDFGAALETAGGIARALPLLCPPDASGPAAGVFWVLAGDVYAPRFAFTQAAVERFVASGKLAHLWLVPNPEHNLRGDFGLELPANTGNGIGLALNPPAGDPRPRFTYSTIGLYRKALFVKPWCDIPEGNPQGTRAALAPLLRAAMDAQRVSAELFTGDWTDVGTVERLQSLNAAQ